MRREWRAAEPGDASTGPGGPERPARAKGFVDYERVALRYQQGRSLPGDVVDRWGNAVRAYLKPGPLRVLDLGAGTGVFASAWPGWTTATVVAVEPSAAMARVGGVVDPAVSYVQGVAEALPLKAASIDVAWVSTALHHFDDVDRAVDELARILVADGRVLVRTYVPDRTEVTWVDQFPGRSRWAARFHRLDQLVALFGNHGFHLEDITDVLEGTQTFGESARWVEQMRWADSILTALSDEEIAAGLDVLRSKPTTLGRLQLTLLAFAPAGIGRDRMP